MALPANCNSSECASQIHPKHRGICPTDWHIPNDAEWIALTSFVGANAGTKLKAASSWNSYIGVPSGTDAYGFAALPSGVGYSDGNFDEVGVRSFWWSTSEYSSDRTFTRSMLYNYDGAHWYDVNKNFLFSVRCVKD